MNKRQTIILDLLRQAPKHNIDLAVAIERAENLGRFVNDSSIRRTIGELRAQGWHILTGDNGAYSLAPVVVDATVI